MEERLNWFNQDGDKTEKAADSAAVPGPRLSLALPMGPGRESDGDRACREISVCVCVQVQVQAEGPK